MDQDALVETLRTGTIRAAALDVTHPEPLPRSLLLIENTLSDQEMHFCETLILSAQSFCVVFCRDHPLLRLPNVLITPHIGISTLNTAKRMVEKMVENAVAAVKGLPVPDEVK